MENGAGVADPASRSGVPAGSSATELEVEPANLTEVADVVEEQADRLAKKVRDELESLHIDDPSIDITSRHAARGWNALLTAGQDAYCDRVQRYVMQLQELVARLRAAAAEYEQNEHSTAAALKQLTPGDA